MNKLFQKLRQVLITKVLTVVSVVEVTIKYFSSDEDLFFGVKIDLEYLIGRVLSNDGESCDFLIISF